MHACIYLYLQLRLSLSALGSQELTYSKHLYGSFSDLLLSLCQDITFSMRSPLTTLQKTTNLSLSDSSNPPHLALFFAMYLLLSRVQLFATLWTVALQASLSMGSRHEYWNGLPFPSLGFFAITLIIFTILYNALFLTVGWLDYCLLSQEVQLPHSEGFCLYLDINT